MSTLLDKETKTVNKKPDKYVAVILNDDFTTFDMVDFILKSIFNKSSDEASVITHEVHKSGKGVAGGPYTFEVCETKCMEAMDLAKSFDMPLHLLPEKA